MALRGVNLGGWLVLEKWITPSLFAGTGARDEYSFCAEGGANLDTLTRHRESFITEADFKWLSQIGIGAVRLPIGYWVLDGDGPLRPATEFLDKAFEWADRHRLKVLLDLHGAPGSQNGWAHSGKSGRLDWHRAGNVGRTLEILGSLSERYGQKPALWGIELLNEPRQTVPLKVLRNYYERAYEKVRKYCSKESMVVFHDSFRTLKWSGFMDSLNYDDVLLDTHLYQCFSRADKHLSIDGHLNKARFEWAKLMTRIDKPVIVGEWSLGLDPATFTGMDDVRKKVMIKTYADAQLETFEGTHGWFFWTYKTEDKSGWNFRHLVENGLIVL